MGERSGRVRGTRVSTRGAILAATQSLLLELGADQVTIRRVEERSGFKAPTIYHHFRDKTGLIDALLEERCAELYARTCASSRAPTWSSGSRTRATTR